MDRCTNLKVQWFNFCEVVGLIEYVELVIQTVSGLYILRAFKVVAGRKKKKRNWPHPIIS